VFIEDSSRPLASRGWITGFACGVARYPGACYQRVTGCRAGGWPAAPRPAPIRHRAVASSACSQKRELGCVCRQDRFSRLEDEVSRPAQASELLTGIRSSNPHTY